MRVILDTNVWSRIGDFGQGEQMARYERETNLTLVVPPSTLLEVLRTPNPEYRDPIVAAMTLRVREHPPTEASCEAAEVVAALKSFRPDWVNKWPNTSRISTLHNYWTKRLWVEARRDPSAAALRLGLVEGRDGTTRNAAGLVEHSKATRRDLLEHSMATPEIVADLRGHIVGPENSAEREGWDGSELEMWRYFLAALYWKELVVKPGRAVFAREDLTFADWAGPFVNRAKMAADRSSWNRLFYYEVEPSLMPRSWLRCAVRHAQYAEKVSVGNPADEQHSAYLPGADVFISGDVRYVKVLQRIRAATPIAFAEPRQIDGAATDVVGAIEAALA